LSKLSLDNHEKLLNLTPLPWHAPQWSQLMQQKQAGQLAHAYLVQGDQGLGKRLFVEKFAIALLCLNKESADACGECSVCKMAVSGSLPDLIIIEPEEGSRDIKIDQIRMLSKFVNMSSHAGSGKVVVLDRAHNLNNSAANALLKTLEEPTATTFLFLITDLPGALSATIRSRCQRLQFSIPSTEKSSQWLFEQLSEDSDKASLASTFASKPLLAFTQDSKSGVEDFGTMIQVLSSLLNSSTELRPGVVQASKIGELLSIGHLIEISTILIKGLLTEADPLRASAEINALSSQLRSTGIEYRSLSVILLNYQQELVKGRHQLMSGSNPNPQLIIESLLWQWTKLFVKP
jgi:DNA polymerase-3 subunit delta'